MTRTYVEVHVPPKTARRYELTGAQGFQVIDGRIQFVSETELAEHPCELRLSPSEQGVFVEVLTTHRNLLYAGQEQRQLVVPWGEEVFLGSTRLSFLLETGKHSKTSSLLILLLPLGLALTAVVGLKSASLRDASSHSVEAPNLAPPVLACPEQGAALAMKRGDALSAMAQARQQRFPFSPEEGVRALDDLAQARSCYAAAGQLQQRSQADKAYQSWLKQLNEAYTTLQLRLRVATDSARWSDVETTAKELLALTAPRTPHAYTDWLIEVRREAEKKRSPN